MFMFKIAFEDSFYKFLFSTIHAFVTPISQLNHDVLEFVYICKAYISDPIFCLKVITEIKRFCLSHF